MIPSSLPPFPTPTPTPIPSPSSPNSVRRGHSDLYPDEALEPPEEDLAESPEFSVDASTRDLSNLPSESSESSEITDDDDAVESVDNGVGSSEDADAQMESSVDNDVGSSEDAFADAPIEHSIENGTGSFDADAPMERLG